MQLSKITLQYNWATRILKILTHILQVLDLVVNAPIKRHQRCHIANLILASFHVFRHNLAQYILLNPEGLEYPTFRSPKPSLAEGINNLLSLFNSNFKEEKFKKTITDSFIKTGSMPSIDDNFEVYNGEKKPTD